jgi:hypothetical protein
MQDIITERGLFVPARNQGLVCAAYFGTSTGKPEDHLGQSGKEPLTDKNRRYGYRTHYIAGSASVLFFQKKIVLNFPSSQSATSDGFVIYDGRL